MSESPHLPAPFAWIDIPGGTVTLEDGHGTFDVEPFAIARYPVTNGQFAKFVEAGGYAQRPWWTDAGWALRDQDQWMEPRHWADPKWNGENQPVVGVSWYESLAFSLWLSEVSGERVFLPTEQQWQRAAQGDAGRIYPWGNDWDGKRCNNSVGLGDMADGQTTAVTAYEGKGDSPYGVVDMSGNV